MKAAILRFNQQLRRGISFNVSVKGVRRMSESNPIRFEKFTERARKVLTLAQEEAQRFNHNYIGTEHLLLGLVREGDGVAAKVLANLGVDIEKVRGAVTFIIGRGERASIGEIGLTPRSKKVIELAVAEAQQLNHHYIGTEHLLLGLVREGEGIAAGVLESLGVSLEKVRSQVIRVLNQSVYTGQQTITATVSPVETMGTDLTAQARQSTFDPVIGREVEIERMWQILSRRTKANVLIVGEPGVGKTALVENLAQRIADGAVRPFLLNRRVLSLDTGLLAAQAALYTKSAETLNSYLERLEKTIAEVRRDHAILFIDEIHLLGQAITEGNASLLNVLKQAIAQEQIQVIAATTPADYQKYVQPDEVFGQFLQTLKLAEPSVVATIEMLRGLKSRYETFHQVLISDEAVQAAAELAERYPSQRFRPDRAIDLMDEAAVLVRSNHPLPPLPHDKILEAAKLTHKIHERQRALTALQARNSGDLSQQIADLEQELAKLEQERVAKSPVSSRIVTKEDVAAALNQSLNAD